MGADTEELSTCLTCAVTGELFPAGDVDRLVDAYERACDEVERLKTAIAVARQRMLEITAAAGEDPDKVTRRLEGLRRKVKIELPAVVWDQTGLKNVAGGGWSRELVSRFLTVATYRVNANEFKKAVGTTGPDELMAIVEAIKGACRGRVGQPSVVIEK